MHCFRCFEHPSLEVILLFFDEEYAGVDIFKDSLEIRRHVGYLPENAPLYTDMRVSEYLDFVADVAEPAALAMKNTYRAPSWPDWVDTPGRDGTA